MVQKGTKIFTAILMGLGGSLFIALAQTSNRPQRDAVAEAQQSSQVKITRPEQQKNPHDNSDAFSPAKASPSSPFETQPKQGKLSGFDFARDPLNADRPNQSPEEIMKKEIAKQVGRDGGAAQTPGEQIYSRAEARSAGLDGERQALAHRSYGTVASRNELAANRRITARGNSAARHFSLSVSSASSADEWRPSIPEDTDRHVPRLERFDVDHDLPEAFLPEFPPAIFLNNRPELGDVSRGEVVSINNYFYRLFKDILTPAQLDGLQFLLTPFPQEEFNPTDDRKTRDPSLGVTCLDCHVNGHTTGQFHLSPDIRPQERRFRLDTVSLRGLFNQQIHGSKRSLRSVEDFTEFEQRTVYFNGDAIHALKKGANILDRVRVPARL